MFRFAFCRRLLILGISMMVALPWSTAASPEAHSSKQAAVSSDLSLLSNLLRLLTGLWAEVGCTADPDGHGIISPSFEGGTESQSDVGCGIDPDGHCVSSPSPRAQSDAGCGLDPSGSPCFYQ